MSTPAEQRVRDFYGFDFPDEFFWYREFLAKLPPGVLAEACDMRPAYPFDLADGKPVKDHPAHPLWEGRYYHDLPEFVTLFHGTTDGLHWGYYFDSPGEMPPVVCHYWHGDTFQHAVDGDTLFEATRWQVESSEEGLLEMIEDDPDEEAHYRAQIDQLAVIRRALGGYWGGDREETGADYEDTYGGAGWREPVADTWDHLGIVVAEKQYKKLSADSFRVAKGRAEPQPTQVMGLAAEAMQLLLDGYPGAALKLGRDLWMWAKEFPECYDLLDSAYAALRREPLRRLLAEARAWRQACDKGK